MVPQMGPAILVCAFCAAFPVSMWWVGTDLAAANQPANTAAESKAEQQQPREPIWSATYNDPVALWTFALTVFSAILSVISYKQFGYLRSADKTARIAAYAAKESADAARAQARTAERTLTDLEGPLMLLVVGDNHVKPGIQNALFEAGYSDVPPEAHPWVRFHFKNYGRSPATIAGFGAALVHWTGMTAQIPRLPLRTEFGDFTISEGAVTQPESRCDISIPLDQDAMNSIRLGRSYIFLYGHIEYADIFRNNCTSWFCWRYDYSSDHFVPMGARYNYTEKQQQT